MKKKHIALIVGSAWLLLAVPAEGQTLDYDHNDAQSPDGHLSASWTVRGEGLRVTPPVGDRAYGTSDTLHLRGGPDIPRPGYENSVYYQCASNTARGVVWYGANSRTDAGRQIDVVCFTQGEPPGTAPTPSQTPTTPDPGPEPEPEPEPTPVSTFPFLDALWKKLGGW